MHNRMPSRPRQGQTTAAQGETQDKVPRLPNERDESADSQRGGEACAQRVGKRAHDDLEQGQTDTDKGPVLDAAYKKQKK